jgi:hypothetical protein
VANIDYVEASSCEIPPIPIQTVPDFLKLDEILKNPFYLEKFVSHPFDNPLNFMLKIPLVQIESFSANSEVRALDSEQNLKTKVKKIMEYTVTYTVMVEFSWTGQAGLNKLAPATKLAFHQLHGIIGMLQQICLKGVKPKDNTFCNALMDYVKRSSLRKSREDKKLVRMKNKQELKF